MHSITIHTGLTADTYRFSCSPVSFVVPGRPKTKGRPRFSRITGTAYTPKSTTEYEKLIARRGIPHINPDDPWQRYVAFVTVVRNMPSKFKKAEREASYGQPCITKPDADNVVKAILDGINRIPGMPDDAACIHVGASKRYVHRDEMPHVDVVLVRDPVLESSRLCRLGIDDSHREQPVPKPEPPPIVELVPQPAQPQPDQPEYRPFVQGTLFG